MKTIVLLLAALVNVECFALDATHTSADDGAIRRLQSKTEFTNTYSTPEEAWDNLKIAIEAAGNSPGTELVIDDGTYKVTSQLMASAHWDIKLTAKNHGMVVFTGPGTGSSNQKFMEILYAGAGAIVHLEGLKFGADFAYGTIFMESGTLSATNCTFSDITPYYSWGTPGMAIRAKGSTSSLTIHLCQFHNIKGPSGMTGSAVVFNPTNNGNNGPGTLCITDSEFFDIDLPFSGNTGQHAVEIGSGEATIERTNFHRNKGGLSIVGADLSHVGGTTVGNYYVGGTKVQVQDCEFRDSNYERGALTIAGSNGIALVHVDSSEFTGNRASYGAGVFVDKNSAIMYFTNNAFATNNAFWEGGHDISIGYSNDLRWGPGNTFASTPGVAFNYQANGCLINGATVTASSWTGSTDGAQNYLFAPSTTYGIFDCTSVNPDNSLPLLASCSPPDPSSSPSTSPSSSPTSSPSSSPTSSPTMPIASPSAAPTSNSLAIQTWAELDTHLNSGAAPWIAVPSGDGVCGQDADLNHGKELVIGLGVTVTLGAGCPTSDPPGGGAKGDAHFIGHHGDRADFKGLNNTYYNLLSTSNLSVAVLFLHDTYNWRNKIVFGSWMKAIAVTAMTDSKEHIKAAYSADKPEIARTTRPDGNVDIIVPGKEVEVDGVVVELALKFGGGTFSVSNGEWLVSATTTHLPYHTLNTGKKKKLDVQMKPLVNVDLNPVAPHGLIGQTYDRDSLMVNGKVDNYASDRMIETSAMAEGAIEGIASDYAIDTADPFSTIFKYSRFGRTEAPVRDVSKLSGKVKMVSQSQSAVSGASNDEPDVGMF